MNLLPSRAIVAMACAKPDDSLEQFGPAGTDQPPKPRISPRCSAKEAFSTKPGTTMSRTRQSTWSEAVSGFSG